MVQLWASNSTERYKYEDCRQVSRRLIGSLNALLSDFRKRMPPSSSKPPLLHLSSSTSHYQTFPSKPPTSHGKTQSQLYTHLENPPGSRPNGSKQASKGQPRPTSSSSQSRPRSQRSEQSQKETPLPARQLAVLAIIALAEQTALNSIAPYLPDMVSSFPNVEEKLVGTYVGLVASCFALAQFITNFFWGWLSDRIGRKPVILTGTLLTAACFVGFGFCQTMWQAMLAQALMGLVNGNQGVVSTCLGELTDRTNQSRAFTYLPVIYGIGGITGPIVGGLLVKRNAAERRARAAIGGGGGTEYPYLAPNLLSAGVLMVDLLVTIFLFEESLEEMKDMPPLSSRVHSVWAWLWQFAGLSRRPTRIKRHSSNGRPHSGHSSSSHKDRSHSNPDSSKADNDAASISTAAPASPTAEDGPLFPQHQTQLRSRDVFNPNVILILTTFLIFQLSLIAYNSLFPIFAQARPPLGRALSPEEIGISLAFAGAVTIVFQVGVFGRLKERMGNRTTYRWGLGGFVLSFLLMPWVGYADANGGELSGKGIDKRWLYVEIGVVLVVKTVASVGGLTSALLLVSLASPICPPCQRIVSRLEAAKRSLHSALRLLVSLPLLFPSLSLLVWLLTPWAPLPRFSISERRRKISRQRLGKRGPRPLEPKPKKL